MKSFLNFNSTKVRLKLSFNTIARAFKANFNSTKVRLKPSEPVAISTDNVFQFHKGPIKTAFIVKVLMRVSNFNSTKVRLKLKFVQPVFSRLLNFNSTKVRLKLNAGSAPMASTHISIPQRSD